MNWFLNIIYLVFQSVTSRKNLNNVKLTKAKTMTSEPWWCCPLFKGLYVITIEWLCVVGTIQIIRAAWCLFLLCFTTISCLIQTYCLKWTVCARPMACCLCQCSADCHQWFVLPLSLDIQELKKWWSDSDGLFPAFIIHLHSVAPSLVLNMDGPGHPLLQPCIR